MCNAHTFTFTSTSTLTRTHIPFIQYSSIFTVKVLVQFRAEWRIPRYLADCSKREAETFHEFRVCLHVSSNIWRVFFAEKVSNKSWAMHSIQWSVWIKRKPLTYTLPIKNSPSAENRKKNLTHGAPQTISLLRWIKIQLKSHNIFYDCFTRLFSLSLININVTCFVTRRFAFIPLARPVISDQA